MTNFYDKLHVMNHQSKALDRVRRDHFRRLSGKDRSYIEGQRYTLLSTNNENLDLRERRGLKKLLVANMPVNYSLYA